MNGSQAAPRVALVTGGASGMGRVYTLRMAARGAKVAVIDRNASALAEVSAVSPNISVFNADVSDAQAIQAVVDQVTATHGSIERLVAAAGIMPALSIAAMPASDFSRVMRINYEGIVNAVKAVLPAMTARRAGEIVLFGSLAGVVPCTNFAAYNASKAAINMFGEVLGAELEGSGIRVLTVRPAAVRTPLIAQATGDGGLKGLQRQEKGGKMASPEQIIDAVERGLRSGKSVIYPTSEARFGDLMRRISPKLTWMMVKAANK